MSVTERRIGAKITELRLSMKITQAELAEKINTSVETISRLERGVSFPSLKTLEHISTALNAPLKNFFDFDGHEPRDKDFERELSKFLSFLRTLDRRNIALLNDILKTVFKKIAKKKLNPRKPSIGCHHERSE